MMVLSPDELLDRALQLPEADRIRLVRKLLESLEQFELTEEQRGELQKAMAEIDREEYLDGDSFLQELGTAR